MKYENEIMINGKIYHVMVVDGERYVDGLPIDDWLDTVDLATLAILAAKGLDVFESNHTPEGGSVDE